MRREVTEKVPPLSRIKSHRDVICGWSERVAPMRPILQFALIPSAAVAVRLSRLRFRTGR